MFGFFRRRRIDHSARRLGQALANRYGARRFYPAADVMSTAAMLGIGGMLLGYGVAAFCTRDDYERVAGGLGAPGDYEQLRAEVDMTAPAGGWDGVRDAQSPEQVLERAGGQDFGGHDSGGDGADGAGGGGDGGGNGGGDGG